MTHLTVAATCHRDNGGNIGTDCGYRLHATHSTPNANNSAAAAVKKKKKNHNRTLDYNRTERWLYDMLKMLKLKALDAASASAGAAVNSCLLLAACCFLLAACRLLLAAAA